MAYDKDLARRVRDEFARAHDVTEKRMFGGVAFLLNGNMCVGVWKDSLIARLGDSFAEALENPSVRPFDVTGRAMRGWVMVEPDVLGADEELGDWIGRCVAFVRTLPAKEVGPRR